MSKSAETKEGKEKQMDTGNDIDQQKHDGKKKKKNENEIFEPDKKLGTKAAKEFAETLNSNRKYSDLVPILSVWLYLDRSRASSFHPSYGILYDLIRCIVLMRMNEYNRRRTRCRIGSEWILDQQIISLHPITTLYPYIFAIYIINGLYSISISIYLNYRYN